MSNSTISLMNKYLFSKKFVDLGPIPLTYTEYTNVTYPDNFTGLSTYFSGLEVDDCYVPYTLTSGGYKAGNYELYSSSYNFRPLGTDANSYNAFVGTSTSGDNSYFSIGAQHTNFYDKGVLRTNYTQTAYGTNGVYRGGGSGASYYNTNYVGGSVIGEWLDMKFPFKVKLTDVNTKMCANIHTSAVDILTILGSNDYGTTWNFIQTLDYPYGSPYTWIMATVTTNDKYDYIRFVFNKGQKDNVILLGEMQLKFSAFAGTPITKGYEYTYSNITFPNDYTNLQSNFGALTQQDTVINFQPETQDEWWKDLSSYKIEASSYGVWNTTQLELPQYLFDGSNTTFWAPCESNTTFGNTFDKNGVDQGQYTQLPYNGLGSYQGGGSPSYFYSFTTEETHTINGEYIDITFPTFYKAILNSLSIMTRDSSNLRGPANVGIIGSNNNGTTWNTVVENILFNSNYLNNTYQTKTVPAITTKYNKFRIIFKSTKGDANLNIADIKFNYDAYIKWG